MRLSLVSLQVQLQQLQAATLLAALAAQSGTPCARIDGEGQYYFQVWTKRLRRCAREMWGLLSAW